jgi:hypothetical protein
VLRLRGGGGTEFLFINKRTGEEIKIWLESKNTYEIHNLSKPLAKHL